MEEKENIEFSLPALLLVTGFCFLSFGLILKILDGVNMTLFFRIGFITFASGILTGVYFIAKRTERNQHSEA